MSGRLSSPSDRRDLTDRDLSWLDYNARLLELAADPALPLLERWRFLGIFTDNLDEFFAVRVGRLRRRCGGGAAWCDPDLGRDAPAVLTAVCGRVRSLYARRAAILGAVEEDLRRAGLSWQARPPAWWRAAAPSVREVTPDAPWPAHRERLGGAVTERDGTRRIWLYAAPQETAFWPAAGGWCWGEPVRWCAAVPDDGTVTERFCLRVTRYVDPVPQTDTSAPTVSPDAVRAALEQSRRAEPVRLEVSGASGATVRALRGWLALPEAQVFTVERPWLPGAAVLGAHLPPAVRTAAFFAAHRPRPPRELDAGRILPQVLRRDRLLTFPEEDFGAFLRLIAECADDPAVTALHMTVYRLARPSRLVERLCAAARNGKAVTVLVELRARGDEAHNLACAAQLEAAGCTVLYGPAAYKVHAKICLITRAAPDGVRTVTQIGTGNYNEDTARVYADLCLLTADPEIGADAARFFDAMAHGAVGDGYRSLVVAPHSIKAMLLDEIAAEAGRGAAGSVFLKLNALSDRDLIEALRGAARAGTRVRLAVRGICCLPPENGIVLEQPLGRFLEHARVYAFGEGARERMFLASADGMPRNTARRVEIACPVRDAAVRARIRAWCAADARQGTRRAP